MTKIYVVEQVDYDCSIIYAIMKYKEDAVNIGKGLWKTHKFEQDRSHVDMSKELRKTLSYDRFSVYEYSLGVLRQDDDQDYEKLIWDSGYVKME
jgi:hypothetical protein